MVFCSPLIHLTISFRMNCNYLRLYKVHERLLSIFQPESSHFQFQADDGRLRFQVNPDGTTKQSVFARSCVLAIPNSIIRQHIGSIPKDPKACFGCWTLAALAPGCLCFSVTVPPTTGQERSNRAKRMRTVTVAVQ